MSNWIKIKSQGYAPDYSKSRRALEAEESGLYPLTEASRILSRQLGTNLEKTKKFLKEEVGTTEWHHTSSWYNPTDYYNTNIEDIVQDLDDYNGEDPILFLKNKINNISIEKSRETVYNNCIVEYLEWSGTRNYPVAKKITLENCTVIDKGGDFVEIITSEGRRFRKKKYSKGFKVIKPNGYAIFS